MHLKRVIDICDSFLNNLSIKIENKKNKRKTPTGSVPYNSSLYVLLTCKARKCKETLIKI